jgi:cell division protein ZapB
MSPARSLRDTLHVRQARRPGRWWSGAYNARTALHLRAMSKLQELADRVERLLLRHQEQQRTNTLLQQQLSAVTQERDLLRGRLTAARTRIDALLERLPAEARDGNGSAP